MKTKNHSLFKIISILMAVFIISILQKTHATQGDPDITKINDIISKMTLVQKVKLVVGTGMHFELPDSIAGLFPGFSTESEDKAYQDMVNHIRKNLPGAAGFTAEYPDMNITTQVLADGPAGLRISPIRKGEENTYYCTAFPIATLLASTWNTELVNQVGKAMGNEVLEYNADIILGPGMNLQRDPLCGRNFEYYSEDPLVTGKMAAAMVKGIQSNGVGTSIKHFAVNNQETYRNSVNTIVSERALRELYLRGFEIAVKEASPWTVMSSYNKVNGVYTSESHDLLTNILREDWGFQGYVMTDWGGGSDVIAQMTAGNDLLMPGTREQIITLVKAVEDGKLDEKILNKNLSRILAIMLNTPKYKGYKPSDTPDLKTHAQVTRTVATEGMILLENKDETLPLASDIKNIAVFGTTSYEFISGGTGSGDVNEAYTVSLMDGLKNGGFKTDNELREMYTGYIKEIRDNMEKPKNWIEAMKAKGPVSEMDITKELVDKMADKTQLALITIGRNAGEGSDREAKPSDFYLTDVEHALINNVCKAFQAKNKKVVVILNIGGVIETKSWCKIPDAVLCAWQPGQEAGNSVVDVITGKSNPSGKVAITWPVKYEDSPTAKNFPGNAVKSDETDNAADLSGISFMKRVPWEVIYEEDIYVGYRYYSTFDVPVSYEFGYGMSYTNYDYSDVRLNKDKFKDKLIVSATVKNTGKIAGKEVIQVYISAPDKKLEKPALELVAFGKTQKLAPGESQTLNFTITGKEIASFDETSSSWIVEEGQYELKVGASSKDIKVTKNFTVKNDIIVGKVNKALAPNKEINRLTKK